MSVVTEGSQDKHNQEQAEVHYFLQGRFVAAQAVVLLLVGSLVGPGNPSGSTKK